MLHKTVHLFFLITILLCQTCDSAAPVFLQAISSALATIPFTGFPMGMSAGLAGAKMAVGAKLLYYLGFFGQRERSKPPASPVVNNFGFSGLQHQTPMGQGFLPLPYSWATGTRGQAFNLHSPDQSYFSLGNPPQQAIDPNILVQALASQGINPLQLLQAFGSLGIDPEQLLPALGINAPIQNVPGSRNPLKTPSAQVPITPSPIQGMPQDFSDSLPLQDESGTVDGASEEDVESFFNFLRDMDDNKCISRLVCDIGRDPKFLGEFSENIDNIISSLDVPAESGANSYIEIMKHGRETGGCSEKFKECDDSAYEIVKSVAPNVGVPGMNSDVN